MSIEDKRLVFYGAVCFATILGVIVPLMILAESLSQPWSGGLSVLIFALALAGLFLFGFTRRLKFEKIWRPVLNRVIHPEVRPPK
ncbi:MAG: hypothetical protein CMK09_05550 [Ponticaulis sp.]|nr:hypothetical protein [Ponticaulis sp.]|tara:strand:+ start:15105 stop:15359 length:255 start_codon:yes stop_codon:yes gene_type:complete